MFNQKSSFTTLMNSPRGLSLVEILVALTLIGLAAGFIVGPVLDNLARGEIKVTKIQMSLLSDQVKEFKRYCGFYPTSDQGLEALLSKPSGRECKRYPSRGLMEEGAEIPLDPWDNEYIYESDGRTFDIISWGRDGQEGGDEYDADISLRAKRSKR